MNPEQELAELESLIDQLLNGLQETIQSGEILSDEFQAMIAQELTNTTDRVDFLKQQIGQGQEPEAPTEPAISDESQLLWILSGSNPETFVQYLQTYPGDEFGTLLQNPEQLARLIADLQSNAPPPTPGMQKDGIPKSGLQSSNVYGSQYDPKTGKLLVRFQEGAVYEYDGVPPYVFKAFQAGAAPAKTKGKNRYGQWWVGKNPSLGAALNTYIKQANYNYRRVR